MNEMSPANKASLPQPPLAVFPRPDGSRVSYKVFSFQEICDREQDRIYRGPPLELPGFRSRNQAARLFVENCLYEIIPKKNEGQGLPVPVMHCDNAGMLRDRVMSLRHANIFEAPTYRHFVSALAWT